MKDESRPEPEAFLGLVPQSQTGHLKVYIGGAAGVGKTYRMLVDAHQLKQQGRDIVIGFVETHGREETAGLVGGLELIPLRQISHRGVILSEMDLDAILARKPEIVVVDELAHTNTHGSRHNKRYQDVEELVAAGLNVITAVNIQHLESLNPVVKRVTGVEVKETVPDAFLARADEIVLVDVSIEELRQRLREGKIYPLARVEQALRNFFKPSNLYALRELALHEVARGQGRHREELEALKRERGRPAAVSDRLMACLSSKPEGASALLRKAARTAGRLNAEWFAVHVETPGESVQKISTSDFRALLDNVNLAADLGAEVVWLKAPDVVKALLDFANEKKITLIVIGRTSAGLLEYLLRRSVTRRLLSEAREFDVEIVGIDNGGEQP